MALLGISEKTGSAEFAMTKRAGTVRRASWRCIYRKGSGVKNFSDAEIGITRSDLRRILEWWYNKELATVYNATDRAKIEVVRLSPDAKYVLRINVRSPTVKALREQNGKAA